MTFDWKEYTKAYRQRPGVLPMTLLKGQQQMSKFHFEFTTDQGEVGHGKIDDIEFQLHYEKDAKGDPHWSLNYNPMKYDDTIENNLSKRIYKELDKYHYKTITYLRDSGYGHTQER